MQIRFAALSAALAGALGAAGVADRAEAAPVTAVFDLTSPIETIVAPAGGTAVFTADTGIRFSAVGGVRPSLGSGILDADVLTGPDGAGVAGNTRVNGFEYFTFFGPSAPDGTPLAGRWTAFTAIGDAAPGTTGFNIEWRDFGDLNDNPGFYNFQQAEYLTAKRFDVNREGEKTWTLTYTGIDALFSIVSLEYTYESGDVPRVPLPASGLLLAGALGAAGAVARRRAAG